MAADNKPKGGAGRSGYLNAYTDETLIKNVASCVETKNGKLTANLERVRELAQPFLENADDSFNQTEEGKKKVRTYIVTRVRRLRKKGIMIPVPTMGTQSVNWDAKKKKLNDDFSSMLTPDQSKLFAAQVKKYNEGSGQG
jgi:hypothetical protein